MEKSQKVVDFIFEMSDTLLAGEVFSPTWRSKMKIEKALIAFGLTNGAASYIRKGYEGPEMKNLMEYFTEFYFNDVLMKTQMTINNRYSNWANVPDFIGQDITGIADLLKLCK